MHTVCPHCGTGNVQSNTSHPTMTHRCRECPRKPFFSVKTGTVMQGSKVGYQMWATAMYLFLSSLKGVSSMKLHRDLGVTQKTAWHLAMRHPQGLRADGTGSSSVRSRWTRPTSAGRSAGARAVASRPSSPRRGTARPERSAAVVIPDTKRVTLHRFIEDRVDELGSVYTDELRVVLEDEPRYHFSRSITASSSGRPTDGVNTNGIESFWSMLKRAHKGTFHKLSEKHMQRYVEEFSGRHNVRELDTADQMLLVARSMRGKRLTYRELTAA